VTGKDDGALIWDSDGRDWPHRAASRFVSAAGLNWHVQQMGSGPVMLLVHGTGASTHSWAGLMPLLAERFTVIAVDLPGHGFTHPLPSAQMSLPGIAAALSALLTEIGAEPAIAVGHSAGAAILARMTLDRRIAPRRLIALNGALMPFGGAAGHIFPAMAKLLFINPIAPKIFAWRAGDRAAVTRVIASTGSSIPPENLALYQRLFRSRTHVAAALAMMANWNLSSLAKELPRLPCPMTLVVGSGDLAVPPDQAFELARTMPGAKVELLRGLGHLAHEEDPPRVAAAIVSTADVAHAVLTP
jgi:magnesium chelatase accessory protein